MKIILLFLTLFIFAACTSDNQDLDKGEKQEEDTIEQSQEKENDTSSSDDNSSKVVVEEAEATDFSYEGFDDKKYYELLIETHLCNPNFDAANPDGSTPCSSKLFKFFPYNHKRDIENAFILQVKAGVNNYPYRRLLIFVREKGELVLMNGIIGYLVERKPRENDIDDLVVAIIDDLGNNQFDRYDVLLRYKEGKYHFVEAIGDLQGDFDNPKLKKEASKAIEERINQKELIF